MAKNSMTLPQGFVLDQPQKQTQQPKKQSQLPEGFIIDKPAGGISGQDIAQYPFKSTWETLDNPVEKSLTGRSMEEKAKEKSLSGKDVKPATSRPFDSKLGDVQDTAFKNAIGGQIADAATTPSNYVGVGLAKPIVKLGDQIAKGTGKLLGYESGRLINSMIKPAAKHFNFGKNPGLQVAKEGITANNLDELGTKIDQKLKETETQLNQKLSHPNISSKVDNYTDAIKPIDEAIAKAKRLPKTNQALITRLENARNDILGLSEDSLGNKMAKRDLTRMTPQEAVQLKRDIGDATKWTKELDDDKAVNIALKKSYGQVRGRIEKNVPGVKDVNERYANLISAKIAAANRENMLNKADLAGGLFEKGSLMGALVEGLKGDFDKSLEFLSAFGIKKIMDSPTFRTHTAKWLNNLSRSDIVKTIKEYPQLKKLLSSARKITNNNND